MLISSPVLPVTWIVRVGVLKTVPTNSGSRVTYSLQRNRPPFFTVRRAISRNANVSTTEVVCGFFVAPRDGVLIRRRDAVTGPERDYRICIANSRLIMSGEPANRFPAGDVELQRDVIAVELEEADDSQLMLPFATKKAARSCFLNTFVLHVKETSCTRSKT